MSLFLGKDIKLQGPSSSNGTGRVEMFHNGQWGTVCDDNWDINDARVACRQLGYRNALKALEGSEVPSGSGQIWLDEVGCTGSELNLTSCSSNAVGSHDCSHSEDAGVQCTSEGKLRDHFHVIMKTRQTFSLPPHEYN